MQRRGPERQSGIILIVLGAEILSYLSFTPLGHAGRVEIHFCGFLPSASYCVDLHAPRYSSFTAEGRAFGTSNVGPKSE